MLISRLFLFTEKIRAKVSIEITGISPAVKDYNGVMVNGIDEIEVEALPQDLPERITIDISNLKRVGDGIYVRDLPAMDKVEIHSNPDDMLIIVTGGTGEEVAEEGVAGVEEPEVIEKGKKKSSNRFLFSKIPALFFAGAGIFYSVTPTRRKKFNVNRAVIPHNTSPSYDL